MKIQKHKGRLPERRVDRRLRLGLGLTVALAAFATDQVSKWFILEFVMDPPRTIPLTPFFSLVLGFNRGVSFGLFNTGGDWLPMVLIFISLSIVGMLLLWLSKAETLWDGIAIGAIIGGALGNVVDRVGDGAVTDFLDFFVGSYHWPAFNLADTAIVIGAGMIVIRSLFGFARSTGRDSPVQ